MYNKLFTKILDSTIWLESDATRLVWITFLAVMDEDGFVALSAVGNVAARARVSVEAAEGAIKALESPDRSDPSQDHEGRRIERVPYGWMVLNATKYRELVARQTARESNRERVRRHRARNAPVTPRNVVSRPDTQSEAVAVARNTLAPFGAFWAVYPRKKSKGQAEKAWLKIKPDEQLTERILHAVERAKTSADWMREGGRFIPHPATWLNAKGWEDEAPLSASATRHADGSPRLVV